MNSINHCAQSPRIGKSAKASLGQDCLDLFKALHTFIVCYRFVLFHFIVVLHLFHLKQSSRCRLFKCRRTCRKHKKTSQIVTTCALRTARCVCVRICRFLDVILKNLNNARYQFRFDLYQTCLPLWGERRF